jgi:hypothetical protein
LCSPTAYIVEVGRPEAIAGYNSSKKAVGIRPHGRGWSALRLAALHRAITGIQIGVADYAEREKHSMSKEQDDEGRPCLHCIMVELIDEFFAEYPAATSEPSAIDTNEAISAIAKTVAELTCSLNSTVRQQIIEQLMREIMNYDAEFRREDGTHATGSGARH